MALAKRITRNFFWLMGVMLFVEVIFNLHGLGQSFLSYGVYHPGDPSLGEDILIFTTVLTIGGWLVVGLIGAALSREWRMS